VKHDNTYRTQHAEPWSSTKTWGRRSPPDHGQRYFAQELIRDQDKVPTSTGAQSMCLPFGGHDSKIIVGNCEEEMEFEMVRRSMKGIMTHGSEFWWK
jgi:hypothetical protein